MPAWCPACIHPSDSLGLNSKQYIHNTNMTSLRVFQFSLLQFNLTVHNKIFLSLSFTVQKIVFIYVFIVQKYNPFAKLWLGKNWLSVYVWQCTKTLPFRYFNGVQYMFLLFIFDSAEEDQFPLYIYGEIFTFHLR